MKAGVSFRRWLGDEPAVITDYTYNDGLLVRSVARQEPEWDERSRLVLWAYMDYEADLHTCGRPLSESLAVAGSPQPDYVIGEQICLACQKLEAHVHAKHKDGVPPDRLMRVWTRGEAQAFAKQQAIQQKG